MVPLSVSSEFTIVVFPVYFATVFDVPFDGEVAIVAGKSPSPIVTDAGGAAPPVLLPKNVCAATLPVHENELPDTIPVNAPLAPETAPAATSPPVVLIPVAPV